MPIAKSKHDNARTRALDTRARPRGSAAGQSPQPFLTSESKLLKRHLGYAVSMKANTRNNTTTSKHGAACQTFAVSRNPVTVNPTLEQLYGHCGKLHHVSSSARSGFKTWFRTVTKRKSRLSFSASPKMCADFQRRNALPQTAPIRLTRSQNTCKNTGHGTDHDSSWLIVPLV